MESHVGHETHDKHDEEDHDHAPDKHIIEVMFVLHCVVDWDHGTDALKCENSGAYRDDKRGVLPKKREKRAELKT